ncbi:putative voltage-gated potassium channel subunit beta [Camellia lanceoleosa]|uniref:Voltage-gated potassium channel subunit beta n=1 Tax=Camellia lanceoleosa TaxID=1840588 RepID=A0ACC0IW72_9ERIC|nr:putative voltage-gated potassium channel subunit beta [Camellia lanceoleosa]
MKEKERSNQDEIEESALIDFDELGIKVLEFILGSLVIGLGSIDMLFGNEIKARKSEKLGDLVAYIHHLGTLINLASRSLVEDVLKKVNGLKPIADELGVPLSQLAIAWCATNPNVSSVITGATKESQIQENMKAIDVIPLLTPTVLEKIEAVVQSKPKRADSYR